MIPERPALERRLLAALEATPPRVPVLLGGCGTGRTSLLLRVREVIGRPLCQYVDVERVATTPERFLQAVTLGSPFAAPPASVPAPGGGSARDAFDATLAFFSTARPPSTHATFLLDEAFECRTFESFPGLRSVLRDFIDALSSSPNRFILTSRYIARAHRLLRDAPAQFEVIHVPPLTRSEIALALNRAIPEPFEHADDVVRAVHALTDGRPRPVSAVLTAMAAMERRSSDAVAALASQLATGGQIDTANRYCYELRLHRARGYGALKAILDVLAEEEPLTLTEIATRLRRTPGSTKDYLSWLEDVDLITSRQKRYSFADPTLRLWVRLHCRPVPPTEEDLAREVHAYAVTRLPRAEPVAAGARTPGQAGDDARSRPWGIIEID